MSLLLAFTGVSPDSWVKAINEADPSLEVVIAGDPGVDLSSVRHALVWKPQAGLLKSLPHLETVFSIGAGVDYLMDDPTLPDVTVVRVVDADLTARMTEWVVLQVLLQHRRQRLYDAQQRQRLWRAHSQVAARDVRVGIMGVGVLGQDAARALTMLGFDVAGWSRTPKTIEGLATYDGDAGLDAFLARTDILVVLLPLTDETRGILNAALFAKLAKDGPLGGAVLINAGRGGLQVEADIIPALERGDLIAASLDVFQTEPLPETSPLWDDERIVITPHVAAESDPRAIARYVAGQIRAAARGEPLKNVVDRRRGY
ncbi:Glyoxylate/hydroxypyruvate reductase A [Hartmannibacter diazotrophicus]|uniref:Glyoxylate/hydroxypyruvate reductase A n=1 Tax=Hartmannibacter diazotrophicus TaxID=1482074 RepID=A0A2C9D2F1_9HYPH|nr:glyoxylate/hydroxypyruvate reductase A [Hartmannibacter diazotrophicus]SON53645.1 Glyoxylate/hydroxypyruvate reductase A [Hartmannibacter diazotrophicus]